jgi:hypothetical protein
MFLLSQFIVDTETDFVTPFTVDKAYEQLAFETLNPSEFGLRILMNGCLPTPDINTPIKKIVRFKQKRRAELLRFRSEISSIQQKLCAAISPQEINDILLSFKEALELEILTVDKVLKDEKINFAWNSISSLLGLDNPSLFNALIASGIITAPINPSVGIGIGSIGVAGQLITNYVQTNKLRERSPLSYLLLAKRAKIINHL